MGKDCIRYSEAFKRQVVEEVERGRYASPHEARKAYGIGGAHTVAIWIGQQGKSHLLGRVIRVEKADEAGEMKRLKERIRQLERALADAHMDLALEKGFLEHLCRETKTDAEAFKKKASGQSCMR